MPPAARRLHDPPIRGHGLLTADHHHLVEVGIDDFALVERQLDPLPICVKVLIGAGNVVYGNDLPNFGEALIFFAHSFDPRLGRRPDQILGKPVTHGCHLVWLRFFG
jgi:hypothetical protein